MPAAVDLPSRGAAPAVRLAEGDCLDLLAGIPDASVDLICADLPYGTTDRTGRGRSRTITWDAVLPMDALWAHYRRVLVRNGTVVLFADQPFTSHLVTSNPDWFKYEWIWRKNRTTGFLTANFRPMKQTEDILVFSEGGAAAASARSARGNMTYNPQGLRPVEIRKTNKPGRLGKVLGNETFLGKDNQLLSGSAYTQRFEGYPSEILDFDVETGTVHETQKPVALLEYLIATYSHPGQTVLDHVMGSGTAGVAAVNLGRGFVGMERDPDYFQVAAARINAAHTAAQAPARAQERGDG